MFEYDLSEDNEKLTGIDLVNPFLKINEKLIDEKESLDMTSLFEKARENNLKLGVEYTSKYWIDIGRYESLESANKYFER